MTRNGNKAADSDAWSTASGYPKQCSSTDASGLYPNVVALAGGKWYCAWATASGGTIYGRLWDGSSLSSIETISDTAPADAFGFSLNAWGDEVICAWEGQSTYYYTKVRRRMSGSWISTVNVGGGSGIGADNVMPSVTVNQDSGDIFVWFKHTTNYHLYYAKYDRNLGAWDAAVDVGSVGSPITDAGYCNAALVAAGDYAVFCHAIGTSDPYSVCTYAVLSPGGGDGPRPEAPGGLSVVSVNWYCAMCDVEFTAPNEDIAACPKCGRVLDNGMPRRGEGAYLDA